MSAFSDLLESFRTNAQSEREKGNSFESLVKLYLQGVQKLIILVPHAIETILDQIQINKR